MKKYTFRFCGSEEEFRRQYRSCPRDVGGWFLLDPFQIEERGEEIRFLVQSCYSGGYWYLPEITRDGQTLLFSGGCFWKRERKRSLRLRRPFPC